MTTSVPLTGTFTPSWYYPSIPSMEKYVMTDTTTSYPTETEADRAVEANRVADQKKRAAKLDGTDKAAPDAPATANEVLARVDERHYVKVAPVDMNSTPGIKEQVERNTKAIQALANFIDGV